jgi:glycerol kinase
VPAFVGLGAPIWDPHARGTIIGLTRNTGIAEIVRATLEAVGYQTRDLMLAMHADLPDSHAETALRVDGGMVANSWVCQFLADILDVPVERPVVTETTALGAAYLAGLAVGLYPSLESLADVWQCERRFEPKMAAAERHRLYAGWLDAVRRSRGAIPQPPG